MSLSNYQTLLVEQREQSLWVTFNHPDQLNPLSFAAEQELLQLFLELRTEPGIRSVVLTGAGRAFCAGGDLDYTLAIAQDTEKLRAQFDLSRRLIFALLDVEQPLIARLNGDAIGIGATLALFCDLIIAADTARIGDPHVRMGLVAGDGGAAIWPQLVGYARAKQYLLSGDLMTAAEAERIGLINLVVPTSELDATVAKWTGKFALAAPNALRWTKATINIGLRQVVNQMLDAGLAYEMQSLRTEDLREAITAFKQKRKPVFTGK